MKTASPPPPRPKGSIGTAGGKSILESQIRDAIAAAIPPTHPESLDFILDIPLEITVQLGRTTMVIHDLLKLGQGSIIELNKMAGEPLEILANQRPVARGEVVLVNEKYGIRLTEIISPIERVEKLR